MAGGEDKQKIQVVGIKRIRCRMKKYFGERMAQQIHKRARSGRRTSADV